MTFFDLKKLHLKEKEKMALGKNRNKVINVSKFGYLTFDLKSGNLLLQIKFFPTCTLSFFGIFAESDT